jgi:hypothetical protein
VVGLAQRQDRSVSDRTAAELQAESVGTLVVEAAAQFAEPQLLEPLLALEQWWDVDPQLLSTLSTPAAAHTLRDCA